MTPSHELRRLAYLAAMGVPVYLTRRALPGAAPTHKLRLVAPRDLPPPASGSRAGTAPATTGAAANSPALALRESLRREGPATRTSAVSDEPASVARAAAVEQEKFRIAAVVCAERLWLEELGDGALATEQLLLIQAMGQALLHPAVQNGKPQVTQFDWPVHENLQLDLGAKEAAASLRGFLLRQVEDSGICEVVCLGSAVANRVRPLGLPCAVRCVAATRRILEEPARKAQLWTELRA